MREESQMKKKKRGDSLVGKKYKIKRKEKKGNKAREKERTEYTERITGRAETS